MVSGNDKTWLSPAVRAAAATRSVKAGEALFHRGDKVLNLFEVIEGHVRLSRVDRAGREVLLYIAGAGETLAEASLFATLPDGSTGNGIRFGADGTMYVADYTGHNVLVIDMDTRQAEVFAHLGGAFQPNDIALAPDGALYASDPDWANNSGQLWRIGADGQVRRLEADMGTTNGIEVSPDGRRLYVNESAQRNVWVYDIDAAGDLSNKRLLIAFADHGLDGMRSDVDGNLYIARYGAGLVAVVSPKQPIDLPSNGLCSPSYSMWSRISPWPMR